jgi:hypothetical protein
VPRFSFPIMTAVVAAACFASPAEAQTRSGADVGVSLTVLAPAHAEFSSDGAAGTPMVSGLEQPIVTMIRTPIPVAPAPAGASDPATEPAGISERRTWIITPNA